MKKTIFVGERNSNIFVTSFKKETIISPTQVDKTTTQLQKIVKDNGIDKVYPIIANNFPNTFGANNGGSWTFSNG